MYTYISKNKYINKYTTIYLYTMLHTKTTCASPRNHASTTKHTQFIFIFSWFKNNPKRTFTIIPPAFSILF